MGVCCNRLFKPDDCTLNHQHPGNKSRSFQSGKKFEIRINNSHDTELYSVGNTEY